MIFDFFLSLLITSFSVCSASEIVHLKAPDLGKGMITRYSTGLRPYRKTGIRLEAEKIGDKLIIHDYGHGGAGISLSWGCAQEAINMLKNSNEAIHSVAIIGAGVIGLTTAHILKDQGYDVTIYSDEFVPYTTSNKAAGLFSPDFAVEGMSEELASRLEMVSTLKFNNLAQGVDTEFEGVFLMPCYSEKKEFKVTDTLPESHLVVDCNGQTKVCKKSLQIVFDLNIYMNDLFEKAKKKGVIFEKKKMLSINDLLELNESVIFNCTGLGSRALFNDMNLIPIKGHLVIFSPQSEMNFMVSSWHQKKATFFSLIPCKTQLVLGGTMEEGVEDLSVDIKKVNSLIENAHDFFNLSQ